MSGLNAITSPIPPSNSPMGLKADQIAELLDLEPHPEGGYYREVYRSRDTISASALPERYPGERSAGTAIYYLLTADTFSALHRLRSDEVLHSYLGVPVTAFLLYPDGAAETQRLGRDLRAGQTPQLVVPGGVWFGLFVEADEGYALTGTTVCPGFEFEDFELARREDLLEQYPQHSRHIRRLTHAAPPE